MLGATSTGSDPLDTEGLGARHSRRAVRRQAAAIMNPCCGEEHLFDLRAVADRWWPADLKCLIIGESPGGPGAQYFYDNVPVHGDPVGVRRRLLNGLRYVRLISSPTLEAFRDCGFLFDHAIRCQSPLSKVRLEWKRAQRFESERVADATHLCGLIRRAPTIWIMGYLARNAVARFDSSFPQSRERLSPPGPIPRAPRYFLSRYLTHIREDEIRAIVTAFKQFLDLWEQ
jgi:hypothetical protein